MASARIKASFVCGGKYHDFDYARLELLKLLAEHETIRTRVFEDYRDGDAIGSADFLLTYTVDVVPDAAGAERLREFVAAGGRWFALHGTNSVLRYVKGKGWEAPREAPLFMQTLGSQFIAHPPIAPYQVDISAPDHPLVRGIEPFAADDELYLSELHPPYELLLHTRWTGETPGFVEKDWSRNDPRPIMYLKPVGQGQVLYLTLGHARGRYDMLPLMREYPDVERGSWKQPAFHELLRRGIRWAARLDEAPRA
jgi:type 1 glutamine amidotransferase